MIGTIYTIPEMEKVEDGYQYEEKYHNKLFYFKDQFILFREASYDTFPKLIIETVVAAALKDANEQLQESIPSTQSILTVLEEQIEDRFSKMKIPEGITTDAVRKIFDDSIGAALQNVSRVIDNISDKVAKKIEIEDLQSWRTQIEKGVNSLFQENIQKLPEDSIQSILNRLDQIENTKLGVNQDKVSKMINSELKIVHDGLKSTVCDIINQYRPVDVELESRPDTSDSKQQLPNVLSPPANTNKLKITTIAMMKESGMNMAEIAEARDLGLI